MARLHRIETSDGLYHIINRGNYRKPIFETEGAKDAFEKVLWEACERSGWELLAYVVMSNHFHLCLATPSGNLSVGMQWLQGTFSKRFNGLRKEVGRLFQGRFKSLIVEPGEHLSDLIRYIHLNPVHAGICPSQSPGDYPWSSLHHFPKRRSRPKILKTWWLAYEGGLTDDASGWRRYRQRLEHWTAEDPADRKKLEQRLCRGWCVAGRDFKIALAADLLSESGAIRLERDELEAFNQDCWSAALDACLLRLGISRGDADGTLYSARWKLAIASKLKRETSVTNRWLAENLVMGHPNSVSNLCTVYRRNQEGKCGLAKDLKNM